MLVYGDSEREQEPRASLAQVRLMLAEARRGTGLARHEKLVAALIDAGCLAQGLADHAFHAAGGIDDLTPATTASFDLARSVAFLVMRSWRMDFADPDPPWSTVKEAVAILR